MKLNNNKFIFRAYYFFLVMSTGVILPYLNLYYKKIGLNGTQIGTLSSLGMACMFFAPPFWSMVNDKYNRNGRLISFLIVACAVSFFAVSFSNAFVFLIPIVLLFYFFYAPLTPLSDVVALEYADNTDNDNYGKVRLWGTVGFIVASVIFGRFIQTKSIGIDGAAAADMSAMFYGFAVIMAGTLAFSFLLPKEHVRSKRPDLRKIRELFGNRNLILFFVISFVFGAASTASLQFMSIYLDTIGAKGGLIGYAWAFAACFEIVILLYNKKLVEHIGVKWLIVVGMAASSLRWFLCSITRNPLFAVPIQMLHSLTFAAFYVGAIIFVFKESPPKFRVIGQFTYRSIANGLGPILGMLFGGYMLDTLGIFTMYKITSAIIFVTVISMILFVKEPAEKSPIY